MNKVKKILLLLFAAAFVVAALVACKPDAPKEPDGSTPKTHTVTFVADGVTVGTVTFTEGDSSVKEPIVPSRLGYAGKWEAYTLGSSDITVNAVYTVKQYSVSFDVNGGDALSEQDQSKQVAFGSSFSLPVPTRTGYSFTGWFNDSVQITESNGSGLAVWSMADDVELTAHWRAIEYEITFVYDTNIGEFADEKPTEYTVEGLTLPMLQSADGTHVASWRDQNGIVYTSAIPKGTTGNLELTAMWKLVAGKEHTWGENGTCIVCEQLKPQYTMSEDGKTLTFGSYPQGEVTDNALKSNLNAEIQNKLPSSYNANGWTDYGYYIEGSVQSYMWYIDVEYQNAKYRGVYFTSYRPYETKFAATADYSYQDDYGYNAGTVYWFRFEPIAWRILKQENGKALVMANLIVDCQQYYQNSGNRTIDGRLVYPNNYAHSDIRAWLNDNFYQTAFDELSMQFIITTEVDNSASTTSSRGNIYACENTDDKVFLLSYREVVNSSYGFESNAIISDEARQLTGTDYAKSQGLYVEATGTYVGNGWWWLRSPFPYNDSNANHVQPIGISDYNNYDVDYTSGGVVPALNIQL